MVKKYVVEVQEVWLVARKYFTLNDSAEDAIEVYEEGILMEAYDDYEILETRYTDKFEDGYEIFYVYED